MISNRTKIVVIHDDISDNSPIMVVLKEEYGDENVLLHKHSQQGLDYVLNHLGEKMVVLLDKNFYEGKEKSGITVFEEIREKTALVYVILTSVSRLTDFDEDSLKSMINNDLFAFESFTSDYTKIVTLIKNAVEKMSLQVDAVIEDWILRHNAEQRAQPFIKTKDGRSYTMDELLNSIRLREEVGIDFERSLLKLAIDIYARQKTKGQ